MNKPGVLESNHLSACRLPQAKLSRIALLAEKQAFCSIWKRMNLMHE
jgi:hypothetical protein